MLENYFGVCRIVLNDDALPTCGRCKSTALRLSRAICSKQHRAQWSGITTNRVMPAHDIEGEGAMPSRYMAGRPAATVTNAYAPAHRASSGLALEVRACL